MAPFPTLQSCNYWKVSLRVTLDYGCQLCFILSLLLLLFRFFRVFHTSVSCYSFTGGWVTPTLLRSPGLFSVILLIPIMLWSARCRIFFGFTILLIFLFKSFSKRPHFNDPQFFFSLWQGPNILLFYRFFLIFNLWSVRRAKSTKWQVFPNNLSFVFWPGLRDLFVSKNRKESGATLFWGWFWFSHITLCRMVKF